MLATCAPVAGTKAAFQPTWKGIIKEIFVLYIFLPLNLISYSLGFSIRCNSFWSVQFKDQFQYNSFLLSTGENKTRLVRERLICCGEGAEGDRNGLRRGMELSYLLSGWMARPLERSLRPLNRFSRLNMRWAEDSSPNSLAMRLNRLPLEDLIRSLNSSNTYSWSCPSPGDSSLVLSPTWWSWSALIWALPGNVNDFFVFIIDHTPLVRSICGRIVPRCCIFCRRQALELME